MAAVVCKTCHLGSMFGELTVVLMQASPSPPYHIAHTQRDFPSPPGECTSVHIDRDSGSIQCAPDGIGLCYVAACQGTHSALSVKYT
jgi:hypothetical protein